MMRIVVAAFLVVSLVFSGCGVPETYTSSIGIGFGRIEPGDYMMGSENGDFDERPVHRVTISKPFLMAKTEVTNAQHEKFDPSHRSLRGTNGISSGDNEPVVNVSWDDAFRYCDWLSENEGKSYRLPTEAEWEYACRAGVTAAFAFGDSLPAKFDCNQQESWVIEPADLTVAQTPPNRWGLYDMHGNVEEWCLDWYGPYEETYQTDPMGRADGDFKVSRGGSHNTKPYYLRSANRMGTLSDDRSIMIGFRIVIGGMPDTEPLPVPPPEKCAQDVTQKPCGWQLFHPFSEVLSIHS